MSERMADEAWARMVAERLRLEIVTLRTGSGRVVAQHAVGGESWSAWPARR